MNEWQWHLLEDKAPLSSVRWSEDMELRKGDRVRLRPRAGGDVMDLALAGRTAIVESIEQDYEGVIQLGVVVEDDPGADIGNMRQPGHRFFFRPEEVEPILDGAISAAAVRILVAGVGNVFFGDDGFGVEAVARLEAHRLPAGTHRIDFGIRSYDLAYALTGGLYDAAILVDACARGGAPGTIYVIEPSRDNGNIEAAEPAPANAHVMNPESVLKMARALGSLPEQILVIGCEPESLGGEEGRLGLSATMDAAVDRAMQVVETLLARISSGEKINQEVIECR